MNTGERIRLLRESLDLTQDDLAKMMGLSGKSSISKIEASGDKVSLKTIERISEVTGASIPYLMGWAEDQVSHAEPTIPDLSLVLEKQIKDKELVKALQVYFKMTPKQKKHIIDTIYLVGEQNT